MAGGDTISWRSRLQTVVTLSMTEAECMALVGGVIEVALVGGVIEGMWLRGLVEKLGFKQDTVVVSCDSQVHCFLAKEQCGSRED